MKKCIMIILSIVTALLLCSCKVGVGKMGIFDADDKAIDERFKQIVEAIENHDKDTLVSMFSAQALNQIVDFEAQVDYLFEFIQGEIEFWGRTGGPGSSEGVNDDGSGRTWKEIRATYDIKTSEQIYHVSLQEITKHSQDSDKVGISSFCIINAEDWGEEYNYWGDLGLPKDFKTLGIFVDFNKNDMPQE